MSWFGCFFGHAFILDESATTWRGFQIVRMERVCLRCGGREVWTSLLVPLDEVGRLMEGEADEP